MRALYSAAVRRCLLLLLMAVLPFQVTSMAAGFHCPNNSDDGVHASVHGHATDATHAHVHAGDDSDGSHLTGSGPDCSAFHFVALVCPATWVSALPPTGWNAHCGEYAGYTSHIPNGLERPNWRFAA
jgi:hypothetical protein